MKIKVAENMDGLKPRDQMVRVQTVITKSTGNAIMTGMSPTVAVGQTNLDLAIAKLDAIDAMEAALTTLRIERDTAVNVCLGNYSVWGSHVETKCLGLAENVTGAGFDVVSAPGALLPMTKVENNVLTAGDDAGTLDLACDSKFKEKAKSYEWQTSGSATGPFAHRKTTTESHCHLTGFTSGALQWSRVRAINKLGEGPWSDPASAMVP